jgi:hypothetical protein
LFHPGRGEEVRSVLLELTVVEQRFNAVMEVLRDGLTVVEVAERYGVSRQAVHGWLWTATRTTTMAVVDAGNRISGVPSLAPRRMAHGLPVGWGAGK